jgi:hypothetical protein
MLRGAGNVGIPLVGVLWFIGDPISSAGTNPRMRNYSRNASSIFPVVFKGNAAMFR